jgi:26S proteasome regulatory subunit N9
MVTAFNGWRMRGESLKLGERGSADRRYDLPRLPRPELRAARIVNAVLPAQLNITFAPDHFPHFTNSSKMAMDTDTIPNLLESLRDDASDDYASYFLEFEDLHERKLWHELTDKLLEYFSEPESGQQRIALFDTFIKSFANKINQIKLVELGLASVEYRGRFNYQQRLDFGLTCADDKSRLDFLTSLAKSVNKPASQDAYVFATVAVADIQLRQKDYDGARKKLDECEQILDTFDSVENSVHASFYRASAEYYKVSHTTLYMTLACW